jgi:hypothetical protein
METSRTLDDATLALPLSGSGLGGARTLGELAAEPVFLAFLRHGG